MTSILPHIVGWGYTLFSSKNYFSIHKCECLLNLIMLNNVAKDVLTVRSKTYTLVVYLNQLSAFLPLSAFFLLFNCFSSFVVWKRMKIVYKTFSAIPCNYFIACSFFGSKKELLKTHFHPSFFKFSDKKHEKQLKKIKNSENSKKNLRTAFFKV